MCYNTSISVITMKKTKETTTSTRRRKISAATTTPTITSMDDDVHHNQNNKFSASSSITTTKQKNEVLASIDNNDNNNSNHYHDSIVATSSIMVGNFIPNNIDSDDDNSEVVDEEDNDNVSCNTKQQRNHNRQLSSLKSPSTSSRTRSSRRSMTKLVSWTMTSLPSSSSSSLSRKNQSQQQLSNSVNNDTKEKKSLISRHSFRHSQSCNDIDIGSSRQAKSTKSVHNPIKKRSFLFRRSSTKSNCHTNGNDIEEKEDHQQRYDFILRSTSSFDNASSSDKATSTSCSSSSINNDNDSNCSVVSSVADLIENDNVMSHNTDCITYDCNNHNNNNVDNDSSRNNQQQQAQQDELPDLYGQIHVNETLELVETSLQQMNIKLIQHNDINERLAEEKCLINGKVNCTKIKLLFIRAGCFRINEAVDKYIRYWNKRILLFGIERAFDPLTLSSLTDKELNVLQTGVMGIVKKQHQSTEKQYNELIQQTTDDNNNNKYIETRDIIILDYSLYDKQIMATLDYSRVVWYIFHSIMEDIDSSQRGVVFIVVTKNCSMKQLPSLEFMKLHLSFFKNCIPLRLSGMHIIYMPSIIRFVVPIINRLLDDIIKQRLIFHTDIKNEIQCIDKLYNKYGINTNMIPKYIGGNYEWNMKHIWIPKQLLQESNNVVEI